MSDQLALFDDLAPEPKLTCFSGYPWPCGGTGKRIKDGGCPGCRKFTATALRQFKRDVQAGKYNWQGYTRFEWARAGKDKNEWDKAPRRKSLPALPFGVTNRGEL